MPSVTSSISNFVASIFGIFASLFSSVLAVFQGIFALGWDVIHTALTATQHVIAMVADLFQGVLGFVAANFVAIAVLGGAYYLYTLRTQRSRGTTKTN
ncbi:hypothetical protein BDQ12DRAFT_733661 [Crucibulum laeve]|uniref:Uncharacterized protein n=1 Tax=Crucibulum laeve TaxID=68775 RepID=A0A5C3M7V8_9AGAR|nr:hypothetical protein BDQ12DRAFT_733661 [Crucibulum laeve]